jgi:hypothetical protein
VSRSHRAHRGASCFAPRHSIDADRHCRRASTTLDQPRLAPVVPVHARAHVSLASAPPQLAASALPPPSRLRAMSSEFPDILLCAGRSKKRGIVSLHGSTAADSKFKFTSKGKPVDVALSDLLFLHWMEAGKGMGEGGFVLKLGLRGAGSKQHARRRGGG